jgi:uncharacterized lipoprotein YddW (UPF0748 family)
MIYTKDFNDDHVKPIIEDMYDRYPKEKNDFFACQKNHENDLNQLKCMLKVTYQSHPPKADEVRGMWHRPFESDLESVRKTLATLKDMGINHLFVETFFNGQLIFESKTSLTDKHAFVGSYGPYGANLLKAFISEGLTYGIAIHAWVENFFVGQTNDPKSHHILTQKPYWAMQNHDHSICQKNEKNYIFLDPTHPEVQSYLMAIYLEIINSGTLESLHLDYIRYPVSYKGFNITDSDDTGYSDHALKSFIKTYDFKGDFRHEVTRDKALYDAWSLFKIDTINHFVEKISALAKSHHILISTAVFGDPNHALDIKMQDWMTWVKNGWIDIICPMAYYQSDEKVYNEVKRLVELTKPYCVAYAGIAPSYIGLDPLANLSQVVAVRKAEAQGVIFFATQNYLETNFMGKNKETKRAYHVLNDYVSYDAWYKKEF